MTGGKNSYEVLNWLYNQQKELGNDKIICLMGNHEDMFLNNLSLSKINGGNKTIKSFYKNNKPFTFYNWWIEKLPLTYETENLIFVHAGLPNIKLKDNTKEDCLWSREWVETLLTPNEKTVIFGHTTIYDKPYYSLNGNIGIDTGCVYGMKLTALIIVDEEVISFTQVSKHELD